MNTRTIFLNKSQQHFIVDDEPSCESQLNKDDQYNMLTADEFENEVLQCKIHKHFVYYFKLFRLEAEQIYVVPFQKDFVETIESLLSQGDIPPELFVEIVWATHRLLVHTFRQKDNLQFIIQLQERCYQHLQSLQVDNNTFDIYISFFSSLSQQLQINFLNLLPLISTQMVQGLQGQQLSKNSFCSIVSFVINVFNYDELTTIVSPQMYELCSNIFTLFNAYSSSQVKILILNLIYTFGYFFDTQLRILQQPNHLEQENQLFAQVKPLIDLGLINLQQILNLKTNQLCSSFHCSAIEAIGIFFQNNFGFQQFLSFFDYKQYNYFIMSIMRESLRYQITQQTASLLSMTIYVQQQLIVLLQTNKQVISIIEEYIDKEFLVICIQLLQKPFRKLCGVIDTFFMYALPYFSTYPEITELLNAQLLGLLKIRAMNSYQVFSTISSIADIIGFELLSDDQFVQYLQENAVIGEVQYLLDEIFQNCKLEEHE